MSGGGGDNKVKPTAEENALGEIAVERWNDYQTRLRPYEDQYMESVQRSAGDHTQARGQATAATAMSFEDPRQETESGLMKRGVGPGSGAAVMEMGGLDSQQAQVQGAGATEAHQATTAQHMQGLQNVVNLGQGQADMAQTGMGQVASGAASDAQHRAQMAMQESASNQQFAGNLAGMGTSYAMQPSGYQSQAGGQLRGVSAGGQQDQMLADQTGNMNTRGLNFTYQ